LEKITDHVKMTVHLKNPLISPQSSYVADFYWTWGGAWSKKFLHLGHGAEHYYLLGWGIVRGKMKSFHGVGQYLVSGAPIH
jgi:hypothetical protein